MACKQQGLTVLVAAVAIDGDIAAEGVLGFWEE